MMKDVDVHLDSYLVTLLSLFFSMFFHAQDTILSLYHLYIMNNTRLTNNSTRFESKHVG